MLGYTVGLQLTFRSLLTPVAIAGFHPYFRPEAYQVYARTLKIIRPFAGS
jgi:hypothetical protein